MHTGLSPRAALAAFLLCAAFMTCFTAAADAQATRTWVSGVGDDVNPCSRTAPCKTLFGAYGKTASGGEINALDPGGFGALTITKPLTVDLSAVGRGGVLTSGGNGITVNAGAGDSVVLRGVDIMGYGGTCPTATSVSGVNVVQAGSVRIENSSIEGFRTAVRVAPTASDPRVFLNRAEVADNCAGLNAEPAAGRTTKVGVNDSAITNSGTAVRAADGAQVWLTRTTIFDNAIGLETVGTGVIDAYADTRVFGNGTDGTPTNLLGAPANGVDGAPGQPGAPGAPGAAGPQGAPAYKLLVQVTSPKLKAKSGKTVKLGYLTTTGAATTLEVRRGRKLVATVKGTAREGRNAIKWNGKAGRKPAAPGNYTLRLTVSSPDGQTATGRAKLAIKRR